MPGRVLQIVDSLEPPDDTATLVAVSQTLAAEGTPVTVLSLAALGPLATTLQRSGVEVRGVSQPVRHAAQLVIQVRRLLRQLRPDVIHTWSERANRVAGLAAATVPTSRRIASCPGLPRPAPAWAHALDRQLARWTDTLVVNSETALAHCRKKGLAAEKLRLIFQGVPVRQGATETQRQQRRAQLGLPPQAKLIATVGPLLPERRLKDVIWASDLLRVFYQHIYLVVIGDGPDRWRLERYARQVQDRRRTIFLRSPSDWVDWIGAADCLCQPGSRQAVLGPVLEAMAVGVPVLATDIPAHREWIAAEQTGWLVRVGDRGGMSRTLHRILEDRPVSERIGTAAQQAVRQRHAFHEMLQHYLELYRRPVHVADAGSVRRRRVQSEHSLRAN